MGGRTRSVALALLPLAALVAGCDWDWLDGGGKKEHHVKVALAAVPASQKGPGPKTVSFDGIITLSKPMSVKYTFVRSDGTPTLVMTKSFPAGSSAVFEKRVFVAPASGWDKLKVISPENVETLPAKFEVIP